MDEARRYLRLMEGAGLTAYSSSYRQARLTGGWESVTVVVGVTSTGESRVQVTLGERGSRILVVHHARSEAEAEALAERLEEAGALVTVDGERVTASLRPASVAKLAELLRILGLRPTG